VVDNTLLTSQEVDGYLRWATLKAITLLRLERDALDSLADAMKKGRSVAECIAVIEEIDYSSNGDGSSHR
jgi:ribosome-interacting GTPase 1